MTEQDNVTPINQQMPVIDARQFLEQQQADMNSLRAELDAEREKNEKPPRTHKEVIGSIKPDKEYKPVYKLRAMSHRDTMKVFRMVQTIWYDKDFQAAVATGNQAAMMNKGFELLFTEFESELLPWFADLAQVESLDDEPASAMFDIYNDLKNSDDFLKVLKSGVYAAMTSRNIFGG